MEGEARVAVDGKRVANLGESDYFGENALLRYEPRTVTITTNTHMRLVKLTRSDFRQMGLHGRL